MKWLDNLYEKFSDIIRNANIPDEKLYIAAYYLFQRIVLFAVFSKHNGFIEEREWRAVYLPSRDEDKHFVQYLKYHLTSSGVQPKLKLPIAELPLSDKTECNLEKIVHRIILGPTISSPLAISAIHRMLDCLERPGLKSLVTASRIPFRRT